MKSCQQVFKVEKKNLEGNLGTYFLVTRLEYDLDHVDRHCQAREPS
jgi:hypothetical protein